MKTIAKKMKIIFSGKIAVLIIFVLVSTNPLSAQNDASEAFKDIMAIAGKSWRWEFKLNKPVPSDTMGFADASIAMTFVPMDEGNIYGPYWMSFWFTNKTSKPIAINWDQCYITSLSGAIRKIYHGEMKSVNYTRAQEPTTVGAGQQIGEAITPKDLVITSKHAAHYDDNGRWIEEWSEITDYSVFGDSDFPAGDDKDDKIIAAVKGKSFTINMNVTIGGVKKNYPFVFTVQDVKPVKNE